MIRHVLARCPCSVSVLILCTGGVAARAAAPAPGPVGRDTAQIDVGDKQGEGPKLPLDLTFRTRVLAITPAHDVKIDWRYGGEAGWAGLPRHAGQRSGHRPMDARHAPGGTGQGALAAHETRLVVHHVHGERRCEPRPADGVRVQLPGQGAQDLHRGRPRRRHRRDRGAALPSGRRQSAQPPRLSGRVERPQGICSAPGGSGGASTVGQGASAQEALDRHRPRRVRRRHTLRRAALRQGHRGNGVAGPAPDGRQHAAPRPPTCWTWLASDKATLPTSAPARLASATGFPVPTYRKDRTNNDPECGCPFGSQVAQRSAEGIQAALDKNLNIPTPEIWALTIDEIGTVFDQSAEGKKHLEVCPRCLEGFRRYVQGLAPRRRTSAKLTGRPSSPCWPAAPRPRLTTPASSTTTPPRSCLPIWPPLSTPRMPRSAGPWPRAKRAARPRNRGSIPTPCEATPS